MVNDSFSLSGAYGFLERNIRVFDAISLFSLSLRLPSRKRSFSRPCPAGRSTSEIHKPAAPAISCPVILAPVKPLSFLLYRGIFSLFCHTAAFFLSSVIPWRFLPLLSYHGLTMVSRSILIPYPPGLRLGGRSDRYIKVIPRFPTKTRDLRISLFPQPSTFAYSHCDKKLENPLTFFLPKKTRGDGYWPMGADAAKR